MDITPHVNLLRSLRGERIDYLLVIGEGIDNGLDAGADDIRIIVDENEISFRDNGVGITRDRIASLFSLGDHGAMTTTQLGRFGIGIKHQAVNAGQIFSVESVSKDGRVAVEVDWRDVLNEGKWFVPDPKWLPVIVGTPTSTSIVIGDLRKAPTVSMEKIRQDIAINFWPALADGKRITVNGTAVDLLPDPELRYVVSQHFALSSGRTANLRAGLLVNPAGALLNRVHVGYKHRVIIAGQSFGCGEFGGINKMFARLQIAGPWHLAKFKNELPDVAERNELEDAVAIALRPILERCAAASMTARITHISKLVNDRVPPEMQPARPNRKKAEPSAQRSKSRREGKVDAEKSTPLGPARAPRPPQDRLLITFDADVEKDGIGTYDGGGKTKRVDLARGHPYIARLMEHRDERLTAETLFQIAIALYEHHRLDGQLDLGVPFGKRIAAMLDINQAEFKADKKTR